MLFHEEALQYLEKEKYRLSSHTVRTYYWYLKKIAYFAPALDLNELNAAVVQKYKEHLQLLGNKHATICKALSVFRIQHKILTPNEQETLRVFLFSCFTGLRFSDLQSLDATEITDWKIRKQMHKTGDAVYIPIPLQARLLLPPNKATGKVFHVVENSHFNRVLRSAAKKLCFNKYIHCHLARHTFATTCITLGISLSATSKLLGHRNLETTLIYAKYVDAFLDKEMKKFEKLK